MASGPEAGWGPVRPWAVAAQAVNWLSTGRVRLERIGALESSRVLPPGTSLLERATVRRVNGRSDRRAWPVQCRYKPRPPITSDVGRR
jgi:hypothetical protein